MIKASGTTNSSVIQSFRKKPSATCSKQSARYIGLRVKRYGPPRTIVNAGSAGFTFVPAFFIVTRADNASVGAKSRAPFRKQDRRHSSISGARYRKRET